jgi:L-lysine 2,3-aminomutase
MPTPFSRRVGTRLPCILPSRIKADQASFAERGRKHVEMGYVAQYEAAAAAE